MNRNLRFFLGRALLPNHPPMRVIAEGLMIDADGNGNAVVSRGDVLLPLRRDGDYIEQLILVCETFGFPSPVPVARAVKQ